MLVEMKKTACGPGGTYAAGTRCDVSKQDAEAFIASGAAVAVPGAISHAVESIKETVMRGGKKIETARAKGKSETR